MDITDTVIKKLSFAVKELILQTKQLKDKNASLTTVIKQQEEEIRQQKKQITELEGKYNSMMTAKMINIIDEDIEKARKRINKMIHSIDQCISLQNAQDTE